MSAHLTLRPDLCNECGKCVSACPSDAIRVGADYILVDWHACNQCGACIEACDRKAIGRAASSARTASAMPVAPSDVSNVVVGSRAEAKAVRKAAKQAARGGWPLAATPSARAVPGRKPRASAATANAKAASGGAAVAAVSAPAATSTARAAASGPAAHGRVGQAETSVPVPAPARGSAPSTTTPTAWYVVGATWTLADAFVILAVLLVTLVAKNAVLALPAVALMPAAGRAFTRAGVLVVYYGVQVGAIVLLAGRHGCTVAEAFGLRRSGDAKASATAERPSIAVTAALTVGLLVGVEVVAIAYGLIAQAVGWRQSLTLSADVATVFGGGGVGLVLSVLLVALVAPIAEELAFRGVILPAIGARWGQWPAILLSAALFAAYHVSLWLFFPMLVLGAALGWLAVARRSLWPAIALHVMYNSLAVAAAFLVPR